MPAPNQLVQIVVTSQELRWLGEAARLRQVTVEELVREELCLPARVNEAPRPCESRLHVVPPDTTA